MIKKKNTIRQQCRLFESKCFYIDVDSNRNVDYEFLINKTGYISPDLMIPLMSAGRSS